MRPYLVNTVSVYPTSNPSGDRQCYVCKLIKNMQYSTHSKVFRSLIPVNGSTVVASAPLYKNTSFWVLLSNVFPVI